MATKKENKRYVVRRLRRALNLAETPPVRGSNKHIHCGWGSGAGLRDIDGSDFMDDAYDEWVSVVGWHCCEMDCYNCVAHIDAEEGEGWTFESDNDDNPPKLGELFAA